MFVRTWYPEVVHVLKEKWDPAMHWFQVIELCKELTLTRDSLRKEKGMIERKIKCEYCGEYHPLIITPVSIPAMLIALKKASVINQPEFTTLEKSWKKFKRKNNLTAYGDVSRP